MFNPSAANGFASRLRRMPTPAASSRREREQHSQLGSVNEYAEGRTLHREQAGGQRPPRPPGAPVSRARPVSLYVEQPSHDDDAHGQQQQTQMRSPPPSVAPGQSARSPSGSVMSHLSYVSARSTPGPQQRELERELSANQGGGGSFREPPMTDRSARSSGASQWSSFSGSSRGGPAAPRPGSAGPRRPRSAQPLAGRRPLVTPRSTAEEARTSEIIAKLRSGASWEEVIYGDKEGYAYIQSYKKKRRQEAKRRKARLAAWNTLEEAPLPSALQQGEFSPSVAMNRHGSLAHMPICEHGGGQQEAALAEQLTQRNLQLAAENRALLDNAELERQNSALRSSFAGGWQEVEAAKVAAPRAYFYGAPSVASGTSFASAQSAPTYMDMDDVSEASWAGGGGRYNYAAGPQSMQPQQQQMQQQRTGYPTQQSQTFAMQQHTSVSEYGDTPMARRRPPPPPPKRGGGSEVSAEMSSMRKHEQRRLGSTPGLSQQDLDSPLSPQAGLGLAVPEQLSSMDLELLQRAGYTDRSHRSSSSHRSHRIGR